MQRMTHMKLDFTLVVGIIIVGNLALSGLTVTPFASTFDAVNPVNKGSSGQEHPGRNNILQPGQSKSIKWDQRGHDGIQASDGEYKALVITIPDLNLPSLRAYSHFQVKENK